MTHRLYEMADEEASKLIGAEAKSILLEYLNSVEDPEELAVFKKSVDEIKAKRAA
jgi:hypothetical protein